MSVPRPAIDVATVMVPGTPAWAIISASFRERSGLAFNRLITCDLDRVADPSASSSTS